MILINIMKELGDQLSIIPNLNVYRYLTDVVVVPAAIIDYPETYEYDSTYGRGSDRLTAQIHIVISKGLDRITLQLLSKYVDGSGTESIKETLEEGTYTAFDSLRVMGVRFDSLLIGQIEYQGATFLVDIIGRGSN